MKQERNRATQCSSLLSSLLHHQPQRDSVPLGRYVYTACESFSRMFEGQSTSQYNLQNDKERGDLSLHLSPLLPLPNNPLQGIIFPIPAFQGSVIRLLGSDSESQILQPICNTICKSGSTEHKQLSGLSAQTPASLQRVWQGLQRKWQYH